METNRGLIYLQIEAEALKLDREQGVAESYAEELDRVADIVNRAAGKQMRKLRREEAETE